MIRTIFMGKSSVIPGQNGMIIGYSKIDDIILAEIDKNVLTIYTVNNTLYDARDTDKLSASHQSLEVFLRTSRHAVMNIDHLSPLSDSFSLAIC